MSPPMRKQPEAEVVMSDMGFLVMSAGGLTRHRGMKVAFHGPALRARLRGA
jgi:hypothetical protein